MSPDELDETWISTAQPMPTEPDLDGRADLVVIGHPDPRMLGRRFELRPGSDVVLGRASEADISFPDVRQISRRQARVRWVDGRVVVEDLGSKNGTLVNRKEIDRPTVLESNDLVEVEKVCLKFFRGKDVESSYHEAIYELVMRDELTGAYNRRMYERSVERDFFRARRHDHPLSLVLFDIDNFKTINDSYGHMAGDEVLCQISDLVHPGLRREEILARIGGDEFLVLCPDVGATSATILAQRIRRLVLDHRFEHKGRLLAVTCSFGVAELRPEMSTPTELFVAADQLLTASKRAGRDQVSSGMRSTTTGG